MLLGIAQENARPGAHKERRPGSHKERPGSHEAKHRPDSGSHTAEHRPGSVRGTGSHTEQRPASHAEEQRPVSHNSERRPSSLYRTNSQTEHRSGSHNTERRPSSLYRTNSQTEHRPGSHTADYRPGSRRESELDDKTISQLRARRNTLSDVRSEKQILAEVQAAFNFNINDEPEEVIEEPIVIKLSAKERWRDIGKRVRLMLAVLKSMELNSSLLSVRSAIEEQWEVLHSCRETKKLGFNRALFDRDMVRTILPQWAHDIAGKRACERTDTECCRLRTLLQGLKSFDNFSEKVQLTLCRSFTVLSVKAGRVILRKGHVPQNYYLIYSGSVFINVEVITASGHHTASTELVLGKGNAFGEKGLLEDSRRSATVVCREDCELLVADRDTFGKQCPRIFKKELEEKINFAKKLPLFSPKYWTDDTLRQLCSQSQIIEYKINKVVVPDSTQNDWLYICMKGTCRILKCLVLTRTEHSIGLMRPSLIPVPDMPKTTAAASEESTVEDEELHEESDVESIASADDESTQEEEGKKTQLLSAMGVQYLEEFDEKERLIYMHRKRKSIDEKINMYNLSVPAEGSTSLNQLMVNRSEKLGLRGERLPFIYISTMKAREVFDLPRIMNLYNTFYSTDFRSFTKPSIVQDEKDAYVPETGSLVLVSDGAKMLKVKKDVFLRLAAKSAALEQAKQLAFKSTYPPHDAIARSYMEEKQWEQYKHYQMSLALRSATRQVLVSRNGGVPSAADLAALQHSASRLKSRPLSAAISMLSATNRCETVISKFADNGQLPSSRPMTAFHGFPFGSSLLGAAAQPRQDHARTPKPTSLQAGSSKQKKNLRLNRVPTI